MSRSIFVVLAALIFVTTGRAAPPDDQGRPAEYEVKAAFLFNFAKFVDWPPDAFSASAPLAICVAGEDPFGDSLDRLTKGERVNDREMVVRRLKSGDDPRACHILFISESERRRLSQLFAAVRGANVLTVSDIDDFAQQGGVIHLTKQNRRIGFEINKDAADRAGLRISSKLLSLARLVEPRRPRPEPAP